MEPPLVSVVVITKNQRAYLERSLPAIKAAARHFGRETAAETLVVDSGSTDGAKEFAVSAGAHLVEIPAPNWNYARAYNAGFAKAKGEFVVRLSGDAIPANADWLLNLLGPLRGDKTVAATWGRQILPPGINNPVEKWMAKTHYAEGGPPKRFVHDYTVLGSNMALRRALWVAHPFDERLPQVEDYAWAHAAYKRGWACVYVPTAAILHGHDEPLGAALKRSLGQSFLQGLISLGLRGRGTPVSSYPPEG